MCSDERGGLGVWGGGKEAKLGQVFHSKHFLLHPVLEAVDRYSNYKETVHAFMLKTYHLMSSRLFTHATGLTWR